MQRSLIKNEERSPFFPSLGSDVDSTSPTTLLIVIAFFLLLVFPALVVNPFLLYCRHQTILRYQALHLHSYLTHVYYMRKSEAK